MSGSSPAPRFPPAPAERANGERAAAPLGRFTWFVLRKAGSDSLGLRSSALAFLTIVSLVPLLAVISIIAARGLGETQTPLVQLLVEILPYSEAAIRSALEGFVAHAESISGAGVIGLAIAVLSTLLGVEETLNRIWHVPPGGTFTSRLFSFLVVLASGPLLIGAGTSGLLWLERHERFAPFAASPYFFVPTVLFVTWLGLVLLYRFGPNATVRWGPAAQGALLADLLLGVLRYGFGAYVDLFLTSSRVVYGSFAVLLFFFLSVQAAWWIVLVGSVWAYTWQHRHALRSTPELEVEPADPWLGLSALAFVAGRERASGRRTDLVLLADQLGASYVRLAAAVAPLLEARILRGGRRRVRLARDPAPLRVADLISLYDAAAPPTDSTLAPLADLRQRLAGAHHAALGAITFGELFPARSATSVSGAQAPPATSA